MSISLYVTLICKYYILWHTVEARISGTLKSWLMKRLCQNLYFQLSYRFEIWQAHRQHCCRSACQVSERSRGFETLRDLTERRLFGYWDIEPWLSIVSRGAYISLDRKISAGHEESFCVTISKPQSAVNIKTVFPDIWISISKIRRSRDRLIL